MADLPEKSIDRRTVLKGLGAGAVSVAGTAGVASAHHVADLSAECENMPSSVVAGDSFTTPIHFKSGHGGEACFVAAISKDGSNWTPVGKNIKRGLSLGDHVHFNLTSSISQGTAAGDYKWRVSATEWGSGVNDPSLGADCPHAGETDTSHGRSFVKYDDCSLEVRPPVEVADVSFRGCSEVWVAFDAFPVDSVAAKVNINGSWQGITVSKGDLTKIPGQYGDKPVFKYSVSGGDKLVGLQIVGDTYENTNRCAQNV